MHRIGILLAILVALLVAGCVAPGSHPPCPRWGMELQSLAARRAFGCQLTVQERRNLRRWQEVRRLERQEWLLERIARAAEKASRISADRR